MITLFIPVYNEEKIIKKNILKLQNYLKKRNITCEIFIGNNGSTDNTLNIIESLKIKCPKTIHFLSINHRGPGKVFRLMCKQHSFDKVITVDIDLSADLDFIPCAADLLDQGYDIVIGYKKQDIEERKWYRKILSSINILLVRVLLGLPYNDYSIGAKAFTYQFLKGKHSFIDDQTFFVTKLIYFAKNTKSKITEIPIKCRDKRKSKFNLVYECYYKTLNIFKVFMSRFLKIT